MPSRTDRKQPVPFSVLNEEVEPSREHARALVELLLPDIKQRIEKEELARRHRAHASRSLDQVG